MWYSRIGLTSCSFDSSSLWVLWVLFFPCVLKQFNTHVSLLVASGKLPWEQVLRFARLRKKYISLYAALLRSDLDRTVIDDSKEIEELDRELDIEVILQWRYMHYLITGWISDKYVLICLLGKWKAGAPLLQYEWQCVICFLFMIRQFIVGCQELSKQLGYLSATSYLFFQ